MLWKLLPKFCTNRVPLDVPICLPLFLVNKKGCSNPFENMCSGDSFCEIALFIYHFLKHFF